jgi:putative heme-binding domain-containing protein
MFPLGLAALLALGDPSLGKAIFHGKGGCMNCHAIDGRGGSLGPELSEIGLRRTAESLRRSLVDPDAEIYREYFTVLAVTGSGERVEGVALNEDDLSIQLRDAAGSPRSFLKRNLKSLRREERSLMPSFAGTLSAAEIGHVVSYLEALRGAPPAPRPRTREIARVSESTAWLTRPDRDGDERPELLLDALDIAQGVAVADLGAGTGYFTWRLARRVGPRGKVLAVEIQRPMLDRIAEEAKSRGLGSVEPILGTAGDPRLPEGALDLVFIANAYHEFAEPEAILAAARRALKPDGRLVLLEYAKENSRIPISELHRMSFVEMRSEVEAGGFELIRALDFLPLQHGLVFAKRRN